MHAIRGDLERARHRIERALALNPSDPDLRTELASVLLFWGGNLDAAIEAYESARRFNPFMAPSNALACALAYFLKGRLDDAVALLEATAARSPDNAFVHVALAAIYAQVGREDDAHRTATTVRRLHPFFQADRFATRFRDPGDRARIVDALRRAGL